jgi:large subunit ribosomal protein L32e
MHPSGFLEVRVFTPDELTGIDPACYAIRIGASVGGRKRAIILEKANSAGLKVLNPGKARAVAAGATAPDEEVSSND